MKNYSFFELCDKRLSTQEKSSLERDYKERERRCEVLDDKAKNLDDENAKYIEQIRELNQKCRGIEKEKFDEGKLLLNYKKKHYYAPEL